MALEHAKAQVSAVGGIPPLSNFGLRPCARPAEACKLLRLAPVRRNGIRWSVALRVLDSRLIMRQGAEILLRSGPGQPGWPLIPVEVLAVGRTKFAIETALQASVRRSMRGSPASRRRSSASAGRRHIGAHRPGNKIPPAHSRPGRQGDPGRGNLAPDRAVGKRTWEEFLSDRI